MEKFGGQYPIVVTRDLDAAKEWVRRKARGSERYGLLASSNAFRLKPHAIDVRAKIDPINWFLNDRDDTRSSWYLEDAATEFQVQGLELDWTCVTWVGDLRAGSGGWGHFNFKGNRWETVDDGARAPGAWSGVRDHVSVSDVWALHAARIHCFSLILQPATVGAG